MTDAHRPRSDDRTPGPDALPGGHASPLDAEERAGWEALQRHTADAARAVLAGDGGGFEAALGAVRSHNLDMQRVLNAIHVPDDAGEWADALERILRRVPDGWGRWISCGPGWWPLLARLDTRLSAIDPSYEVHQVKEKYGTLRYYAGASACRCCLEWEASHPRPPVGDEAGWAQWGECWEAHRESADHAAADAARQRRQRHMDAAVSDAEAEAKVTCEVTGGAGVLMVRGGWFRTLAPGIPEAEGYRPA